MKLHMLIIVYLCSLLTSIVSQDIMCVAYSFAEDFYGSFNRKGCNEKESAWELVNYKSIEINPPHERSTTALKGLSSSCTSSFPIAFYPGSLLEVEVFVWAMVLNCGINVKVYNVQDSRKEDLLIATKTLYVTADSDSEWIIISLPIKKRAMNGYIKLSSFCEDETRSTILVDSFRYLPIKSSKSSCEIYPDLNNAVKRSDNVTIELEEDELLLHNEVEVIEELEEGSGGPPDDIEVSVREYAVWNPLSIALVSIGSVFGLALVIFGAYQYGKVRGVETRVPYQDEEAVEPARTIPRVRSLYY